MWYLYLIETVNKHLYCGISKDIERRFAEHQASGTRCARSLRGKGPLVLVYQVAVGDHSTALKLEYRVKRLSTQRKRKLVRDNWGLTRLSEELDVTVAH